MRAALALLLLVLTGPAAAQAPAGEPVDVREALSSGSYVNWTDLTVEVEKGHEPAGVAERQESTEELARRKIGPALLDGLPAVRVQTDRTVGELLDEPALGETLQNRVKHWGVAEARYYASGKVVLVGELSLGELLRPWLLTQAAPDPETPTVSAYTGLVVDARGTGARPALVPRLLAPDGKTLWGGALWSAAAVSGTPAIWVSDPAHPAVVRAGDSPLVVRARRARGADLELDDDGVRAVRRHLVGAPALGEGRVVVLVDR